MPNRNVADDASNPNKATIVDNDAFVMRDSESNPNTLKEVLWSLIKSTIAAATMTLTNKTLTAPTIADFTNAAHDHGDADDGGAVVSASATVAGVVELATNAEALAGTDTTRAVTPDDLAYLGVLNGWVPVTDSWTYASASTINVPSDATTKYQVGDRVRFKQGAGYKYYTVAAVAATLLTVDVNTDYTVANSAITDIAYDRHVNPFGFPSYFNWSPTPSGYSVGNGTQVARFFHTGKVVDFWYSLTLGSTSSISGDFNFTLPATPSPGIEALADLTDAGTAGYKAFAVSSTNTLYVRAIDTSGTYARSDTTLSATVPFTWTTNDVIRASGRFLTA